MEKAINNHRHCKNNHDKFVFGIDTNGCCRKCKRERDLRYRRKIRSVVMNVMLERVNERLRRHETRKRKNL